MKPLKSAYIKLSSFFICRWMVSQMDSKQVQWTANKRVVCVCVRVCMCLCMYMYMCMCLCKYVYVSVYVPVYVCICLCMYVHVGVCVCLYKSVYFSVYMSVYVCIFVVYMCLRESIGHLRSNRLYDYVLAQITHSHDRPTATPNNKCSRVSVDAKRWTKSG